MASDDPDVRAWLDAFHARCQAAGIPELMWSDMLVGELADLLAQNVAAPTESPALLRWASDVLDRATRTDRTPLTRALDSGDDDQGSKN